MRNPWTWLVDQVEKKWHRPRTVRWDSKHHNPDRKGAVTTYRLAGVPGGEVDIEGREVVALRLPSVAKAVKAMEDRDPSRVSPLDPGRGAGEDDPTLLETDAATAALPGSAPGHSSSPANVPVLDPELFTENGTIRSTAAFVLAERIEADRAARVSSGEAGTGEAEPKYATSHGFSPRVGNPFADPADCHVMLARYVCPYTKEQHDPSLPPVDIDVFGYRRTAPVVASSDTEGGEGDG